MNEGNTFDSVIKIVAIGDSGAGKTNIITRFTQDQFSETSRSTIGVEFMARYSLKYNLSLYLSQRLILQILKNLCFKK